MWAARLRTADVGVARFENVLMVICFRFTTPESVSLVSDELQRLGAEHPDGVGMLILVDTAAPPPSASAREALNRLMRCTPALRASILWNRGDGLRALLVRNIARTVSAISDVTSDVPVEHHICASLTESCDALTHSLRTKGIAAPESLRLGSAFREWQADCAHQGWSDTSHEAVHRHGIQGSTREH